MNIQRELERGYQFITNNKLSLSIGTNNGLPFNLKEARRLIESDILVSYSSSHALASLLGKYQDYILYSTTRRLYFQSELDDLALQYLNVTDSIELANISLSQNEIKWSLFELCSSFTKPTKCCIEVEYKGDFNDMDLLKIDLVFEWFDGSLDVEMNETTMNLRTQFSILKSLEATLSNTESVDLEDIDQTVLERLIECVEDRTYSPPQTSDPTCFYQLPKRQGFMNSLRS